MIFAGYSVCGYNNTASITPTNIQGINSVKLQDGYVDELHITKDVSSEHSSTIPQAWDFSTILHAFFDGSLNASNVDFTRDNTTHILIKRREKGTFKWKTLCEIVTSSIDDFNFTKYDKYAQNGVEYEYAIVPVTNGAEGNYSINSIKSNFEGIYLVEKDSAFSTIYNLVTNTSKYKPSAIINTLDGKYPFVISNSSNNYYSGNVSGVFMQRGEKPDEVYGKEGWRYRKQFEDFLMNGNPKILKHEDGRMWMIMITGEPSESQGEHPYLPTTTFDFVEIGDYNSDIDMYDNNFIEISERWVN